MAAYTVRMRNVQLDGRWVPVVAFLNESFNKKAVCVGRPTIKKKQFNKIDTMPKKNEQKKNMICNKISLKGTLEK